MLAALALLGAAIGAPQDPPDPLSQFRAAKQIELSSAVDGHNRLLLYVPLDKINPTKVSPKHNWLFEYMVSGFGKVEPTDPQYKIRFRIFSQFRREGQETDVKVAKALVRLWDYNVSKLRLDHSMAVFLQSVDVYLCFGGEPGCEQLFLADPTEGPPGGPAPRVNNIYVYQVTTFTDALEMMREIAHEYGHASLPPVGPFSGPEPWANGDLGERLYMKWLAADLARNRLSTEDTLGATLDRVRGYLDKYVTPLVNKVAVQGPDFKAMEGDGPDAFDAYLGLALYAEAVMPERVLARSLLLGAGKAADYLKGLEQAAAEHGKWTARVPAGMAGQPLWLPSAGATLEGGKVLRTERGWAKVQPTGAGITVAYPAVKTETSSNS